MISQLTIDGKYPLGISPFLFGSISLIWKFIIFVSWLVEGISGNDSFGIDFIIAFIPEIILWLFEIYRHRKYGWIIKPVLNTMKSAGMIKESRPLQRTIFGYNKIDAAPIFYLESSSENKGYLLSFDPNGCPNANQDLLPVLQAELPQYEVIPQGNIRKQFVIRKRIRKGKRLTNADFY